MKENINFLIKQYESRLKDIENEMANSPEGMHQPRLYQGKAMLETVIKDLKIVIECNGV